MISNTRFLSSYKVIIGFFFKLINESEKLAISHINKRKRNLSFISNRKQFMQLMIKTLFFFHYTHTQKSCSLLTF